MVPRRGTVPVSVLVPVKNEIDNIAECIESVSFADEIVVVDSGSADGTIEVAEKMGARVVQFQWDGHYPKKKTWALKNVEWRNDWVLILDADERITPPLAKEIGRAVQESPKSGFYINRRFMFMGGWLRHCGYYPSWNLRLLRWRNGAYEKVEAPEWVKSGDNEVHEHVLLDGEAGYLKNDMLHFAYPTIYTWIEKHNRYSDWEAGVLHNLHDQTGKSTLRASPLGNNLERKRWLKRVARRLPMRPVLRFLYHYLWCQGFRDGYRGWVFCRLLAWYEFVGIAKERELQIQKKT